MKKMILYFLLLLFFCSILNSNTTIDASLSALSLWINNLVPAFFFPLILVRLLTPYHLLYPLLKPLDVILQKLFHMNAAALETILTALLLGFPSSTLYLDEIAQNYHLKKQQYERLCYCCFLASPNFILISLATIYSIRTARLFFLVQLFSIITLLFLTRNAPLLFHSTHCSIAFMPQLKDAVKHSFHVLFVILAYLLMIYVAIDLIIIILPTTLKTPLKLLSEFSSGCFYLSTLPFSTFCQYLFIGVLLAYGGLCVHLQILSSVSQNFHYPTFLQYRILHILLSLLFTYLLFV